MTEPCCERDHNSDGNCDRHPEAGSKQAARAALLDPPAIENTTQADPLDKLITAWPGVGGIEAQEARGQSQVVRQDTDDWVQVPAQLMHTQGCSWADFEALGFQLGPLPDEFDPDADKLFRPVKLPPGWSFDASGHSMWSRIIDEKGFQRVSIFYKAAFYDRRAEMYLNKIPTTAAQDDALNALYPDGDPDYWVTLYPQVRHGDDLITTFRPRFNKDRPNEEWTQRRRVQVSSEGTILSDELFDVTPEQAVEDAQR